MKEQRGITLIALIITIIVMLILVAVTINVAINGGLFSRAKEATEKTQIEADKESLLMAAMACIGKDGIVDFTELNKEAAKLGFSGSNGTYSKAGYTYRVDKNTGKVILAGTSTSEDKEEEILADKPYLNKVYSNITIKDGNITGEALKIIKNKYMTIIYIYYNPTGIIENNEIISCSFNYKGERPFREISKTSDEFLDFVTEYNSNPKVEDIDINDVCDICFEYSHAGDWKTGYFTNNYSNIISPFYIGFTGDTNYTVTNNLVIINAVENYSD